MKASSLVLGNTYYYITFADPDSTMPGVEPFVYIGKVDELMDSETKKDELYCFQDTVSVVMHGYATEYDGDEDIGVSFISEQDLESVLELDEIVEEMIAANNRSKKLNPPQLKKATGTWVTINP